MSYIWMAPLYSIVKSSDVVISLAASYSISLYASSSSLRTIDCGEPDVVRNKHGGDTWHVANR
jgi:hypothetical protein